MTNFDKRKSGWKGESSPIPHKGGSGNSRVALRKERTRAHAIHFGEAMHDAFGMESMSIKEIVKLTERWENMSVGINVEDFLKWTYSALFSRATLQPMQPPPLTTLTDPLASFGGRVGKFLRQLVHRIGIGLGRGNSSKAKALSKAQVILQLKKGSPVPGPEKKEESVIKHRRALEDVKKGKPVSLNIGSEGGFFDDQRIISAIHEVVEEVFQGTTFEDCRDRNLGAPFASFSGHYSAPRYMGGAAFELARNWEASLLRPGEEVFNTINRSTYVEGDLMLMAYHPHLGVREKRTDDIACSEKLVYRMVTKLLEGDYRVKPSFILEPLKVRPVTAGPTVAYWLMRPVQKFLWRTLMRHPSFQLIGKKVGPEALEWLRSRMGTSMSFAWLSGDYSAATDNLRSVFTKETWKKICQVTKFEDRIKAIGMKCLVGHQIDYGDGTDLAEQGNGQLMGSPLSFPILCIINAALCKVAYEKEDEWGLDDSDGIRDVPFSAIRTNGEGEEELMTLWAQSAPKGLRDLPILVNGDDCVMHYNERQKLEWYRITAHAGLEPSPGKCYYARDWMQINSTMFLDTGKDFVECKYMNFSLLKGFKSKGGERRTWLDLGSAAKEFCSLGGDDKTECDRFLSIFLKRQRPLLDEAPETISWFLPPELGGLGIPYFKDDPYPISGPQKLLACYLMAQVKAGGKPINYMDRSVEGLAAWPSQILRSAASFKVPVKEISNENLEATSPYDLHSDYTPFLWEGIRNPDLDCDRGAEDPAISSHRRYFKFLNLAKRCKSLDMRPSEEEIRAWECPRYEFPGGLCRTLRSVVGSPRGLLTRITAHLQKRSGAPAIMYEAERWNLPTGRDGLVGSAYAP